MEVAGLLCSDDSCRLVMKISSRWSSLERSTMTLVLVLQDLDAIFTILLHFPNSNTNLEYDNSSKKLLYRVARSVRKLVVCEGHWRRVVLMERYVMKPTSHSTYRGTSHSRTVQETQCMRHYLYYREQRVTFRCTEGTSVWLKLCIESFRRVRLFEHASIPALLDAKVHSASRHSFSTFFCKGFWIWYWLISIR